MPPEPPVARPTGGTVRLRRMSSEFPSGERSPRRPLFGASPNSHSQIQRSNSRGNVARAAPHGSSAILPGFRIPGGMKDRQHVNGFFRDEIKDGVGESPRHGLPQFFIHDRIHFWMALNLANHSVNGSLEFCAQSLIASLIPAISLDNIELCFGLENDLPTHSGSTVRRFTSVQVAPLVGFSRCASSRRSSS